MHTTEHRRKARGGLCKCAALLRHIKTRSSTRCRTGAGVANALIKNLETSKTNPTRPPTVISCCRQLLASCISVSAATFTAAAAAFRSAPRAAALLSHSSMCSLTISANAVAGIASAARATALMPCISLCRLAISAATSAAAAYARRPPALPSQARSAPWQPPPPHLLPLRPPPAFLPCCHAARSASWQSARWH